MKSRVFKIIFLIFLFNLDTVHCQYSVKITINSADNEFINEPIEIYTEESGLIKTAILGEPFEIITENNYPLKLILISINYPVVEKVIDSSSTREIIITLPSRTQKLTEVVVNARKKKGIRTKKIKRF